MAKKKRKLTPEGRAALAASGAVNLRAWHASQDAVQAEICQEIETFRSDLLAKLGPNVTVLQRGQVVSATACYAALVTCSKRIALARRLWRTTDLLDAVSRLSGALDRALRALGLGPGDGLAPDKPPVDGTLEERREWSKRYVQGLVEDRSAKS